MRGVGTKLGTVGWGEPSIEDKLQLATPAVVQGSIASLRGLISALEQPAQPCW